MKDKKILNALVAVKAKEADTNLLRGLKAKRRELAKALEDTDSRIAALMAVERKWKVVFSRCVDKTVLVAAKSRDEAYRLAKKELRKIKAKWRPPEDGVKWELTWCSPAGKEGE